MNELDRKLDRRNKAFASLSALITVHLPRGAYEEARAALETLEDLLPVEHFIEVAPR